MADNVTADAGSGGAVFATDDVGSVHYPITKTCWGALDTINIVNAASGKALPVQGEAAENAAVTGNPVQVGGRYDTARSALGDGDVGAIALDSSGQIIESNSAAILADTANMDTNLGTVAGAVAGTEMQVDIVSDGAGLATDAKLDDIIADTGAIQTAVELIDNAVDGNYLNTNMNIAGTDVSAGAGVLTAQTQRVTIATDDEVNNLLGTIDADTSSLAGCVGGTELQVDIVSSATLDVSGATVTVDLGSDNDVTAQGEVAHGSAASGAAPMLVGLEGRTTDGTAVDSGDNVRALSDTLGKQVVLQGSVHDLHWSFETNITDTADDEAKAAAAGVKHVVTSVLVTNAHASTATKVEIKDGSTVKITGYAAEGGGGFSLNNGGAPLFIGTANTAVNVANVTDSSNTEIFICGYSIAN